MVPSHKERTELYTDFTVTGDIFENNENYNIDYLGVFVESLPEKNIHDESTRYSDSVYDVFE